MPQVGWQGAKAESFHCSLSLPIEPKMSDCQCWMLNVRLWEFCQKPFGRSFSLCPGGEHCAGVCFCTYLWCTVFDTWISYHGDIFAETSFLSASPWPLKNWTFHCRCCRGPFPEEVVDIRWCRSRSQAVLFGCSHCMDCFLCTLYIEEGGHPEHGVTLRFLFCTLKYGFYIFPIGLSRNFPRCHSHLGKFGLS